MSESIPNLSRADLNIPSRSRKTYILQGGRGCPSSSLRIPPLVSVRFFRAFSESYHVDIENGDTSGVVVLVKDSLELVIQEGRALLETETPRRVK